MRKFSEEHIKKIREARLRQAEPHLGKKHSEEAKRKMSLAHKGKSYHSKEWLQELSRRMKGKKIALGYKFTKEQRETNSRVHKGDKAGGWKGGIFPEHLRIRKSLEYRLWREAVFKRDNYTCIWCGDNRGGNLEADHIKPFSLFPELRFSIDNGRTLCKPCHKKTDTYGRRVYNYK